MLNTKWPKATTNAKLRNKEEEEEGGGGGGGGGVDLAIH
jgi:hypothetical protein